MIAKAANAVVNLSGNLNLNPSSISDPNILNSVNCKAIRAKTVNIVNNKTIPMHTLSTNRYRPENSSAIVASATQPVMEVIDHNETGRLVDFCDFHGLANQVINLIEDSDERQRLGKNARKKIINNYSLNDCLTKQINWVESLLS